MEKENEIEFSKKKEKLDLDLEQFNTYLEKIDNEMLDNENINASTFIGVINGLPEEIKKSVFSLYETDIFLNDDFLEKTEKIKAPLEYWKMLSFTMSTMKQAVTEEFAKNNYFLSIESKNDANYIKVKDYQGNEFELCNEIKLYENIINDFDNSYKVKLANNAKLNI